ncbi:MAG TPA: hypothetical protein VIK86_09320 [Candidatus Paceibacterota bacterium]
MMFIETKDTNKINSDIHRLQIQKKAILRDLEEDVLTKYIKRITDNKERMTDGDIETTLRDLLFDINAIKTM